VCSLVRATGLASLLLAAAGCHLVLPEPSELHRRDGAAVTDGAVDGAAAPGWWSSAWQRRRRITVSNTSTEALPAGLPVAAVMDFDAVVSAPDTAHIRVARWQAPAWEELERHVDADDLPSGEELVWFRLKAPVQPKTSDTSYWLYYDYPKAGWPGDGSGVFELLSLFPPAAAVDATMWALQGNATQSWGLRLAPGSRLRSQKRFNPGLALDVFLRLEVAEAPVTVGFQRTSDFANGEPYCIWSYRSSGGEMKPEVFVAATGQPAPWVGPGLATGTERHIYSIERHAERVVFRRDLAPQSEHTLPAAFGSGLQLRFDNDSSATIALREVHVRQVVSPAPTVSLGPEEKH
jgi:hypothetical protein